MNKAGFIYSSSKLAELARLWKHRDSTHSTLEEQKGTKIMIMTYDL
jgi:hypothetical protein